jgi:hypothetical protein
MKALQLSILAFLCLGVFSSCTKTDSAEFNEADMLAGRGNPNNPDVGSSSSDVPLEIAFNPSPVVEGQPMTITGSISTSTNTIAPECGKIQLQVWNPSTSDWDNIGEADITSTNQEVIVTDFVPALVGTDVYKFRLHYIKGGCPGYANSFSDEFFLTVLPACSGLGIEGVVTSAENLNDGNYLFTVTYTVTTCTLEFNKLKTQGGLTAWTTFVSAYGGENWFPGTSTNQIIRWEELAPAGQLLSNATRNYVVKFKKAWNGEDPITITGDWSVSASLNGVEVDRAEFEAITHDN